MANFADPHNRASDPPPSSRSVTAPRLPAFLGLLVDACRAAPPAGAGCSAAHRKPASSRAIATAIFGVGLCCSASVGSVDTAAAAPCPRSRSRGRLALAPPRQRDADARSMLVVPAGLHQQRGGPARCPCWLMRPRRCFSPLESSPGTSPRIRHQRPGRARSGGSHAAPRGSAWPSACRCRGNTATTRPASRYGSGLGDLRQARIQFQQPGLGVIDRQQIVVDDGALGRVGPGQALDPPPMGPRPIASRVVQPAPQQQLAQAMATPLEILAGSSRARARSRTASSAGVGGCTTVSRPARPSSASFRASRRFVFTRSPGFRGIKRRRDHVAASRAPSSSAAAARSHTARPHRTRAPGPGVSRSSFRTNRCTALRLVRQLPRHRRLLVANQHRDEQILLVCIDAHVRSNVLHDRLPSMRLWRSRALTRDLVALTTVLSAARHYNVTMESRSFHIVLRA